MTPNVIVAANGTRGDIQPFLGLAVALQTRGIDVTLLANPFFANDIEAMGVTFVPVGEARCHQQFYADPRVWDGCHDALALGYDSLVAPAIQQSFDFVQQQYRSNPNLVIVAQSASLNGAMFAAEALGLPRVLISLAPNVIPSSISPPAPLGWTLPEKMPATLRRWLFTRMYAAQRRNSLKSPYAEPLTRFRHSVGLPPFKGLSEFQPGGHDLHLGLFPAWFGQPQTDWPPSLQLTGFPCFDAPVSSRTYRAEPAHHFIAGQGAPLLVTTGTGINDAHSLFQTAVEACKALAIPVLLVGGKPVDLDSDPTVMHTDYIDFGEILPRCRGIIHHGGIGTLAQAIRAGIPQLIRPLAFDQHDNGARIHKLGLGSLLLPEQFDTASVTSTLSKLLFPTSNILASNLTAGSRVVRQASALDQTAQIILRHMTNLTC